MTTPPTPDAGMEATYRTKEMEYWREGNGGWQCQYHKELWREGYTSQTFAVDADTTQLLDHIATLTQQRDRLADDRARFPDRPDDIGRMIEARRGSLDDAAKSSAAHARDAIARAEKAESARDDAVRALGIVAEKAQYAANLAWAAHELWEHKKDKEVGRELLVIGNYLENAAKVQQISTPAALAPSHRDPQAPPSDNCRRCDKPRSEHLTSTDPAMRGWLFCDHNRLEAYSGPVAKP